MPKGEKAGLMKISRDLKLFFIVFIASLTIRVFFYAWGRLYLPENIQKFKTADTVFYYDPIALHQGTDKIDDTLFLTLTRKGFLGYLSAFYRFFGYRHWPVSIFHCILSALSVSLLFISARLFLPVRSALAIGLTAALQIVLVYWSPFVTSETPFIFILSVCILLSSLFIKLGKPIHALLLFFSLLAAFTSRPAGISFALVIFAYMVWLVLARVFPKKGRYLFLSAALLAILLSAVTLKMRSVKIDKVIEETYPQELLGLSLYIDQLPDVRKSDNHLRFFSGRLTLIPGIKIPQIEEGVPQVIRTGDIASYFKRHFDKFFILSGLRIYTLFNPWVPEYSPRHNIFNCLFYYTVYILSLFGFISLFRINRAFTLLILLAVLSQIILIGLTVVDYDFRLRLPIEFLLCIPAGAGASFMLKINKNEGIA